MFKFIDNSRKRPDTEAAQYPRVSRNAHNLMHVNSNFFFHILGHFIYGLRSRKVAPVD